MESDVKDLVRGLLLVRLFFKHGAVALHLSRIEGLLSFHLQGLVRCILIHCINFPLFWFGDIILCNGSTVGLWISKLFSIGLEGTHEDNDCRNGQHHQYYEIDNASFD
jgi:hypothetical protein